MSDVVQRTSDPAQIGKQILEHGGEQGAEYQHQHQGQPHQLPQQGSKRRLQHVAIHHHGQQPVGARHRLHRQQHVAPVQGGGVQLVVLAAPLLEGGRRQVGESSAICLSASSLLGWPTMRPLLSSSMAYPRPAPASPAPRRSACRAPGWPHGADQLTLMQHRLERVTTSFCMVTLT